TSRSAIWITALSARRFRTRKYRAIPTPTRGARRATASSNTWTPERESAATVKGAVDFGRPPFLFALLTVAVDSIRLPRQTCLREEGESDAAQLGRMDRSSGRGAGRDARRSAARR